MFTFIRKNLIAGILVILPVLLTVYILTILFKFVDGILGKFINTYLNSVLGFYIPGLGLILFLIVIFLAGFLATHFLGRKLYHILDMAFRRLPFICHIYPSVKQITEFLFTSQRQAFKQVVLVEYPRSGIWSVGFITNQGFAEAKERTRQDLLSVFIPSSPGPLTGFFVLIPRQEAIYLDIPVEKAIKLIVSGGLLNPSTSARKEQNS